MKTRYARAVLLVLLLLSPLSATAATASSPLLPAPGASDGRADGTERAEALDAQERITLLRTRLAESQDRLRATEATRSAGSPPPGSTPEEYAERLALQRQLVRDYQVQLDRLVRLEELRRARRDLESEAGGVLDEPPPYPIDVVDGLWAKVAAKRGEIETTENSARLAESLQAEMRTTVEQARQAVRQDRERLEKAQADDAADRLRWLYELSELRARQAEAALAALEAERQLLEETLIQHKARLSQLRAQAERATLQSPLAEEERDAKLAAVDRHLATLKRRTRNAAIALRAAQDAVEAARERLREARARTPDDELAGDRELAVLTALQRRLDTRKALAETAALQLEALRTQEEMLAAERRLWVQRFTVARAQDADLISRARQELRDQLEKVGQWKQQALARLNASYPLVEGQRKQLSSLDAGNGARRDAQQVLEAYERRIELLGELLGRGETLEGALRRWQDELGLYGGALPLSDRLAAWLGSLGETAAKLWYYELFTAEDTIVVDGERITGKRSITVSKVVVVLLVLTVGVWVAGRVARLVRWLLARRLEIHVSGAILAYRLIYIAITAVLVIFALTVFKIPFTVFAFLGGALAIGIGFGAQNLINNFISGLILLIERSVQLDDIVELEGVRGQVASIGARYSEIRRFDGVDILIPNSSLLEKNVTNWTLSDRKLRQTVSVGVRYGSPTALVTRLMHEAAVGHAEVLEEPAPVVLFEEFGESTMVFTLYFWVLVKPDSDFRVTASDLRYRLDEAFRVHGIELAYPQRDVHLDATHPLRVELTGSAGRTPSTDGE